MLFPINFYKIYPPWLFDLTFAAIKGREGARAAPGRARGGMHSEACRGWDGCSTPWAPPGPPLHLRVNSTTISSSSSSCSGCFVGVTWPVSSWRAGLDAHWALAMISERTEPRCRLQPELVRGAEQRHPGRVRRSRTQTGPAAWLCAQAN